MSEKDQNLGNKTIPHLKTHTGNNHLLIENIFFNVRENILIQVCREVHDYDIFWSFA